MKSICLVKPSCVCAMLAFAYLFAGSGFGGQEAWAVSFGHMKAESILFLGNSLTLVPGPLPAIGWEGYWGMAASAQEKDYVHLLASSINSHTGGHLALDSMVSLPGWTPGDPITSGGDANIVAIADIFERGYATYDNSKLQQQIAAKPDIVVLQFSENVVMGTFDPIAFKASLETLVTGLESSSNPNIFVTSSILWSNPTIDAIKQQVCAEDPTHRVYVNLGSFAHDSSNYAYSEVTNPYHDNGIINGHPGDKGMQTIASTLYSAMVAHSAPEPGSLVLLSIAGLFLGILTGHRQWIKTKRPVA